MVVEFHFVTFPLFILTSTQRYGHVIQKMLGMKIGVDLCKVASPIVNSFIYNFSEKDKDNSIAISSSVHYTALYFLQKLFKHQRMIAKIAF